MNTDCTVSNTFPVAFIAFSHCFHIVGRLPLPRASFHEDLIQSKREQAVEMSYEATVTS